MRSVGVWTAIAAVAAIMTSCKRVNDPGKIDCDTEIEYQGRVVEGKVEVAKFGVAAKTSIDAVRQIDQVVERYLARWKGMCREYNAGVYSKEDYRVESRAMREKMEQLDAMLMQLANAPDSAAYQAALTAMYQKMVPSEERTTLEVALRVMAQKPGESAPTLVADGASLPTGSRLSFELTPSRPAHVYLYQESPAGEIVVLFPDPRIAARNPLPAAAGLRLPPPPGSFRLNDKDIGKETVHVVASLAPLPQLETTLAGQGVTPAAAACSSRGLEYDAGASACEGTRGLEYDSGGASSLSAVTELGSDRIVQRFSFQHVP
ncbi:MAG TPA: DUF4384 domain-containing protein [Nannocystis sp.]|jgi:hypothetical protein